jgi:hypothetical protein
MGWEYGTYEERRDVYRVLAGKLRKRAGSIILK